MKKGEFKERFIDFGSLPTGGDNRGNRINWKESVGKSISFVYGDIKGFITIEEDLGDMVMISYDKERFKINKNNLKKCALGKMLNTYTKDFKINVGKYFKDEKRDFVVVNREYRKRRCENHIINEKYYLIHCNVCNTNQWIVEGSLVKAKTGCPCCDGKVIVEGVNDIPTTAPEMVKYFQGGYDEAKLYAKSSGLFIDAICPICENKKSIRIYSLYNYGLGCICGDGYSYPEKFMYSVLKQLNVEFIYQISRRELKWVKSLRYDFYIPSLNMIIETHGGQHPNTKFHNGTSFNVKSSKARTPQQELENDIFKEKLAKENEISEYVVVDCSKSDKEFIKNEILNSRLAELYDFSNTDWEECNRFAVKSLVKIVCDYKNKNPQLTSMDLSIIFGINNTTIRDYLKKGDNLGFCNYDVKHEKSLGSYKSWVTRRENELKYKT